MALRSFMWSIESWETGYNEFRIRFTEGRTRILAVKGTASIAPQPNHQPFSQIIRQSLCTLVNIDALDIPEGVELLSAPPSRANHSLSTHLFSINFKQTNSNSFTIPIDFSFGGAPVLLTSNILMMHLHNESYKVQDNSTIVSTDPYDAINLEIHLKIYYESNCP